VPDGDALVAAVVQLVALNDRPRVVQVHTVVGDIVDVIVEQQRRRDHVADLDALQRVVAPPG